MGWLPSMKVKGQTICLSMIVKNEVSVIGRCLSSLRPIIDRWVIVDTGSSDGTQDAIRTLIEGRREEDVRRALAATRRERPADASSFFSACLGRRVQGGWTVLSQTTDTAILQRGAETVELRVDEYGTLHQGPPPP